MSSGTETDERPGLPAALALTPDAIGSVGLQLFCDGCYEPRSDTGGWSFLAFLDGVEIATACGRVARTSNNAMELAALLEALRWLSTHASGASAVLWTDSAYAVTGCNHWRPIWRNWNWRKTSAASRGRSRPIDNAALWMAIDTVLTANPDIIISWCKGHAGIAGNERADALAEQGRLGG